jgi:hypothetical protein
LCCYKFYNVIFNCCVVTSFTMYCTVIMIYYVFVLFVSINLFNYLSGMICMSPWSAGEWYMQWHTCRLSLICMSSWSAGEWYMQWHTCRLSAGEWYVKLVTTQQLKIKPECLSQLLPSFFFLLQKNCHFSKFYTRYVRGCIKQRSSCAPYRKLKRNKIKKLLEWLPKFKSG